MQVAANARCRKIVVRSLARSNVEKRRSLSWDARHNTERILKKAAPPVSTITSDKLGEADFIQRAGEGDRAAFECLCVIPSMRKQIADTRLPWDW
jgi:hypothetical protein